MKKIAIYPGSFDPITNGHIDIIKRACGFVDEVIVGVLVNRSKKPLFSTEERIELVKEAIKNIPQARVDSFSGLLTDYMRAKEITVAIRGLRAVSDLEYEFQMAHTNRLLYPGMETLFLMPGADFVFLTSTVVREVASHGGQLDVYVPAHVAAAMRKKFGN